MYENQKNNIIDVDDNYIHSSTHNDTSHLFNQSINQSINVFQKYSNEAPQNTTKYDTKYDKKRKIICGNCGKLGHEYKSCLEPTTSVGIINIKIDHIMDDENKLLIKKFHGKNTIIQIKSREFSDFSCYYSEDTRIYDTQGIKINSTGITINFKNPDELARFNYYKDRVKFLMISRKFSLGFNEFIRGRYNVDDINYIIKLFKQMTQREIDFISSSDDYDEILCYFMNSTVPDATDKEDMLAKIYENAKYGNEYCESKIKFNKLKNKDTVHGCSINFITKNIEAKWNEPEWGFPKGRRIRKDEDNLTCAKREFEEETGYKSNEYTLLNKIVPMNENLIGTNGVSYKHIYYLALDNMYYSHVEKTLKKKSDDFLMGTEFPLHDQNLHGMSFALDQEKFDQEKFDQTIISSIKELELDKINFKLIHEINSRISNNIEIGEIKWMTFEEAIRMIRPYHKEKKNILTQIYLFIINFLIQNTHLHFIDDDYE
jgi:8-oxo-dGTP pyrophosphatase MutT (NUDIX family)